MTQTSKGYEQLSPLKRAYLALEKAQARIESLERGRHEGIAIVGMGCRLPGGVNCPDDYWRLLAEGRDAVVEVPASRWDVDAYYDPDPNAPGKVCSRFGGFMDGMDLFDAAFFGIAPREVESLDPQQRLLLEVAHETFEDGAVSGDQLLHSPTGVFVGLANGDYYCLLTSHGRERIDAYMGTGTSPNSAAGRVSYVFGLRGPCVAVDTACSSSLVALHLACQALRNGECDMALAGGVNVMLTPDLSITFSKAHMLCPDGHCKTFDAAANGYVRGEGVGLVLLKRLSDAIACGDRICAVIRGSAVNHAGASGGLTVPNGPAQQQVIRRALAQAQLRPDDVDYIEAHGTGTSLGDPIEAGALGAVFAGVSTPVWMGSAKTNLGHLEAAAGIAGVMKVVLALQHAGIPPHLHFQNPSPRIPWQRLPLRVPVRREPWPTSPRRRVAGVSSFGFSGINAHVVIEEAPAQRPQTASVRPCYILPLSAKDPAALRQLAARFGQRLAQAPEMRLADVCLTAAVGRSHFEHRLALVPRTTAEARDCLATFGRGEPCAPIRAGHAGPEECKAAFLFAGDDAPHCDAGRRLYEMEPAFRAAVDQCDEVVKPYLERPLASVLHGPQAPTAADAPIERQLALFAIEYATAQLWQSWGVRPAALVGEGVGEYVAACLAKAISIEDGLRAVATQGREAPAIRCSPPKCKWVLLSTGEFATEATCLPDLGRRPERSQADLALVERTLAAAAIDVFLESGPRGALFREVRACRDSAHRQRPATWLAGFSAHGDAWQELLDGLADLYVAGAAIAWQAVTNPWAGQKVSLPTYPFQRRRYWVPASGPPLAPSLPAADGNCPLLGRRVVLAAGGEQSHFESQLSGSRPAFLHEHRLAGVPVLPASAFFEVLLAAACEVQPGRAPALEGVAIEQAMPFAEGLARVVQTAVKPEDSNYRIELYSRPLQPPDAAPGTWTLHAKGRCVAASDETPGPHADLDELRRRCAQEAPLVGFYARLAQRGLQYGPQFQGLKRLWRGEREALGQVELTSDAEREAGSYRLYPPLVDACLHVTAVLLDPQDDDASPALRTYVPVGVERLEFFGSPGASVWSHARLRDGAVHQRAARYTLDVALLAADGQLVARLAGLQVQHVDLAALAREIARPPAAAQDAAFPTAGYLTDEIMRDPAGVQEERVAQFLEELVVRILKLPRHERPAHHRNLFELGLDSLMSVELLYRINEAMRTHLTMEALLGGAAIAPLSAAIVRELNVRRPAAAIAGAPATPRPDVDAARAPSALADRQPVAAARMRLLCFAPPDADPAVYSQWPAAFPPDLEVCPLPWPAAHAGQAPALLPDWHARVERVAEEVMDLLDRPFALFGYGNAGLLALAVAQTIRDRFGLSPSCLFVAAACPPEHVELPEAAGSEEANASEWFSRRLSTPLDCPLTALAGAGNERLGGDTMLGWRNWTQGSFRLEVLPGDFAAHLESPEQLARIVQHDLVQAVLP